MWKQRLVLVSSSFSAVCFFSQGLSLNQQLANSARWNSQQAPMMLPSLPSQCWDNKHVALSMAFAGKCRGETSGPLTCRASILPREPSPQLLTKNIFKKSIKGQLEGKKRDRKEKQRKGKKSSQSFSANLLQEMTEGTKSVRLRSPMTKWEHPHSLQISTRCKTGEKTF